MQEETENIIYVRDLVKKFGNFVANDHLSFEVKKGEIFGFLGANGAGKSTTIRMLCALLNPTSGTARVGGFDVQKQPEKVKENIGYMSQKFSLYEDLTVRENITFFGGIYGLSNHELANRMQWAFDMAGLVGREDSLTRELAGGWKQRLALGCAVLHQPKIVFLDEPTGGVDPVSRRNFWELIHDLSEQGITIFVTTHFLDEAEYCNNIMFINAAKIIAGGSPQELKTNFLKNPILEIECDQIIDALELFQKQFWIAETTVFGTYIHIHSIEKEEIGIRLTKELLSQNHIVLKRVERILPSLEDVFIHLIEKK